MMERDYDHFYSTAYAWIIFQSKSGQYDLETLISVTPGASIRVVGGVTLFQFHGLYAQFPNVDTFEELEDKVYRALKATPYWCAPNKSTMYSEEYVQDWIDRLKHLDHYNRAVESNTLAADTICRYIEILTTAGSSNPAK